MTVVASNYARKENDLSSVWTALSFDPATGVFCWRIDRALKRAGDVAGNVGRNGYRRITVNYRSYYEHHLAIAFDTGALPPVGSHVDHINGDKTDNRLANLRVVTPSKNGLNRHGPNRNNRGGTLGVCEVRPGAFVAFITVNRKRRHLGTYQSREAATVAREAAERSLA